MRSQVLQSWSILNFLLKPGIHKLTEYVTIFFCFFFNFNGLVAALACPQQHRWD